jgi:hypothetical protein
VTYRGRVGSVDLLATRFAIITGMHGATHISKSFIKSVGLEFIVRTLTPSAKRTDLDRGTTFLLNYGKHSPNNAVLHSTRLKSCILYLLLYVVVIFSQMKHLRGLILLSLLIGKSIKTSYHNLEGCPVQPPAVNTGVYVCR